MREGWTDVALGDICEVVGGGTPKTSVDEFWGGNVLWVTPKDLSDQKKPHIRTTARTITTAGLSSSGARVLPPDSVLLTSRAPIGLVAINDTAMATNQGFKSLVPDRQRADADFIAYWLRAKTAYLQSLGTGATFKEISKRVVERIAIPLPPLAEQRRITRILDLAEDQQARAKRSVALMTELRGRAFNSAFPDSAWEIAELGTLCAKITDGTHQPPTWADHGIPFLFVRNIISETISWDVEKFISDDTYEELTRVTPIEVGDVLYSTVGSYGVPAMVRSTRRFAFQRHIAQLKPDPSKLDSEFLAAAMASAAVRRQADRAARGVAQKTLNLGDIRKFQIPAPPLTVQKQFGKRLAALAERRTLAERQLAELGDLAASLKARAFIGEL